MRSFVFSELLSVKDDRYVAYCYKGKNKRGTIVLFYDDSMVMYDPETYSTFGFSPASVDDYSSFELWAFIHEMTEPEDYEIRQEAINNFYDLYHQFYQSVDDVEEYGFLLGEENIAE